jgi:hypothetical protein
VKIFLLLQDQALLEEWELAVEAAPVDHTAIMVNMYRLVAKPFQGVCRLGNSYILLYKRVAMPGLVTMDSTRVQWCRKDLLLGGKI